MSSLSVSQHINARLAADGGVSAACGARLYPVAVQADTRFPFVAYERSSLSTGLTKDGADETAVDVYVYGATYAEAVSAAEAVRLALDGSTGRYATFVVDECRLSAADEAFADDAYVQRLTFTLKVYNL